MPIKESGVYKIVNLANGKVYIGSAKNLAKRRRDHFWSLGRGSHHSRHLQKSYNKYGKDNFEFVVLQKTTEDKLTLEEQKYIDLHKSYEREFGYNISPKAYSTLGVPCSEEKKLKIAAANLGKKRTPEVIAKVTANLYTRIISDETRKKLSDTQRRRMNLPENKERGRQLGLKNRKISFETIENLKKLRKNGIPVKELQNQFKISDKYIYFLTQGD
jgi:group I intron endonuclease